MMRRAVPEVARGHKGLAALRRREVARDHQGAGGGAQARGAQQVALGGILQPAAYTRPRFCST